MFRRFAATAALSLAALAPARAQSVQAPASTESAACATLHSTLTQHAQTLGISSAQMDSIHTAMRAAVENGAPADSVHHALLAALMHGTSAHAETAGTMQDHMQLMHAQRDSATIAGIHACLSSHPAGTTRR